MDAWQLDTTRAARQRRNRGLAVALLLAGALLSSLALPAQAQLVGDVDVGVSESSTIPGCPIGGAQRSVVGTKAMSLAEAKVQKVGQVFYAAALVAAIDPCWPQVTSIEVVPPAGVELAISAATPVRCSYSDNQGPAEIVGPELGCPQQATAGAYGVLLNRTGAEGPLWDLQGKEPLTVEFPLRSSRPLNGVVGLSCGRRANADPPCRPEQAGDQLQIGYFVASSLDTWLVPHVGLFAEGAGPTATGTPAATARRLSMSAPRALRIRRALRGIPITVQVTGDAVVTARVTAARLRGRGVRRGLIARVTRRAKAGALKLRLKPSRAAARVLRRKRLVTATVRVTMTVRGQAPQTASAAIKLRR